MRCFRWKIDDSGYATVAAAGFAAALATLFVVVAWQAGGLVAREQAQVAADLAAVAGAHVLAVGDGADAACAQAAWVAELNDALLGECHSEGEDVVAEVIVRGRSSYARAGPL